MKTFFNKRELEQHIVRMHKSIRNIECDICEKLFKLDSDLKLHMKMHEKNRSFECSFCEKVLTSEKFLYKHEDLVHKRNKN